MLLELVLLEFGGAGAGAGADDAVPGTLGPPVLSERILPSRWHLMGGSKEGGRDGEGLSRGRSVVGERCCDRVGSGGSGGLRIDAETEHLWPSLCQSGTWRPRRNVDVDIDIRRWPTTQQSRVLCLA